MPPGFQVPGQPPKHVGKCPHPSMMPVAFRWAYAPNGDNILAVIEAHCFGCGAHAVFEPPKVKPEVKEVEE